MSKDWAFFLKDAWIVSAKNLLKESNEVIGTIGGKQIQITPRSPHSADIYIDDLPANRGVGSAEALVNFLLDVGQRVPQEELIREIDRILDSYYY